MSTLLVSVDGHDAVYEVRLEDVVKVEGAADRLERLREVGKHAGHPDDFEDVDFVVWPQRAGGWEDLFEHAREALGRRS